MVIRLYGLGAGFSNLFASLPFIHVVHGVLLIRTGGVALLLMRLYAHLISFDALPFAFLG